MRLLINLRNDDDEMALANFPFMEGQYVIAGDYGDAGVVEIDLADRTDTTAAQEQFLDTNPLVIGYSIEACDLHETER